MERGMALKEFAHWSEMKCGLAQETCVLQWHTDHGTGAAFVPTLATFLLGVYEGQISKQLSLYIVTRTLGVGVIEASDYDFVFQCRCLVWSGVWLEW